MSALGVGVAVVVALVGGYAVYQLVNSDDEAAPQAPAPNLVPTSESSPADLAPPAKPVKQEKQEKQEKHDEHDEHEKH